MPNTKPLDMQMLRMFVTTAEEGSMSNAAKRLGVTQSAISQGIRHLEDHFGVVLLTRDRRPLALTPAGLALRNRGVALLNESDRLKAEVIDASRGTTLDAHIGLVDSFAATCGTSFIKEMLGRATTLSVRTGLSPFLGEALVARELDLAVSTDALVDLDNIVCRRLLTERFLVITPATYSATVSNREHLLKLSDALPILRFNRQSHLGTQVERFLRRLELRASHRLEVDTADTLTSMVAGGIGWAITTPMCMLQAGETARKVKPHFLESLGAERSLYLVGRRDEYTRLFDDTYAVAHRILKRSLVPAARTLRSGLERLIELEPENEQDTRSDNTLTQ